MDSKAKWDERSKEYKGTKSVLATLPDELRARLQKVAVDAYRALRVRDYGRVDLRLTETGEIYVLEVNASCYLEKTSEFAMAAGGRGLDYPRADRADREPGRRSGSRRSGGSHGLESSQRSEGSRRSRSRARPGTLEENVPRFARDDRMTALRQVRPPLHVVHRQPRHQRRERHDRRVSRVRA